LRGTAADGSPVVYMARVRTGAGGWEYSVSGALVGTHGQTKFVLVDQDLDGTYGEVGEDALVVGRGKDATYHSSVVLVEGSLYTTRLDTNDDGPVLVLDPYTGATGTLDVVGAFETKAKIQSIQVVGGDDTIFLDLAREDRGAPVPVGEYRIEQGRLVLGDAHVTIANGRAKPMVVTEGEVTRPELGGPVRAEFAMGHAGSDFQFTPDGIWWYGRSGEEYYDWYPLGLSPRFVVFDTKSGEELGATSFAGSS
ncbi:MAG: hypothetical protein R3F34_20795, partial [Planctomycetota bacterium]